MAAPTVDFRKIEARVVMKFFFLQGKWAVEIHGEIKNVLKDDCLSYSTMKMWMSRSRSGHFEVTDEPRSGRPTSATTEEKAEPMRVMILEDRRISAKVIAETLGISCQRVGHIIHNILDMRKLSAKWVPKCLKADQKRIRVTTSKTIFDRFTAGMANFMARLVTKDETWLHNYDPLTNQQSVEWRHGGSPRPKKFRIQMSDGKEVASVFWDKDGVLLIKYLPKVHTINAEY
ncbi:protein GVQW3-like [Oratosquilla oratoria]|uniref:protein GVQW3-like n=1 Tax=Oratosquilla oratoria TaxID=337810 RepID=UPI003F7776B6